MTALRYAARNVLSKSPSDVVVLSAVRSPITRAFKGGFRNLYPEDIIGPIMKGAVTRANIDPREVNDVLIGNVLAELGFAKTGRMALNDAGFPVTTTFHTVNRQCSSSLQAITHIAHAIMVGEMDAGIAGGVESMSRNYGSRGVPQDVSPRLRNSQVKDARDCLMPMGITSENVADRYGISRKVQDQYGLMSHQRASNAQKTGKFNKEIIPISIRVVDGITGLESDVEIALDDGIRHGLTLDKITSLPAVFKENGGSTAGNSSQISDGAAATVLVRRSWAEERRLKAIGRFVATQVTGCAPDEMGIAPVAAISSLSNFTGISLQDVDIFELNEAFASQTVYCIDKLGLDYEKVNPNGGAIALGHPTGATGARQAATLFAELEKQDKEVGIISMCASTGIGVASMFIRE